jgi:hypothetical protein
MGSFDIYLLRNSIAWVMSGVVKIITYIKLPTVDIMVAAGGIYLHV